MIYYGKAEFGQISRYFSLHAVTFGKKPKNLTQIGFPSLRSVKSDRLLALMLLIRCSSHVYLIARVFVFAAKPMYLKVMMLRC